jgi:hypothetical protein
MRTDLANCLIVGYIGGALGWVAHSTLQQRESQTSASRDTESVVRASSPTPSDPDNTARPQSTSKRSRAQSDTQPAESNGSAASSDVEEGTSETPESAAFVLVPDRSSDVLAMPSNDRSASAAAGESAVKDPLADLLDSMTIWCRFDPGNGAWLREENISMYELAYQGGPISYDSIDIDSGTARMTGSAGATGSREGVLDVLVTATRAGLHFSAFNSREELNVTTVFGAVDQHGRHLAVMTTHGARADGSYQTYGACDTGAPKPDD